MKCFHTDAPSGTFFAVYSDLSGAYLFTQLDDGTFYECVDDAYIPDAQWFTDAGYLWFFNVDDNFSKQAMSNLYVEVK